MFITTTTTTGKRNGPSLNVANDYSLKTRRLFVTNKNTKINFLLINFLTGANLYVYSRKFIRGQRYKSDYELSAANGTIIKTYSTELLILNFGLRLDFTWSFVVAYVSKPIIGSDFLSSYELLVDLRNNKLIDQITNLSTRGRCI